ncbi:hypothetical protein [Kitasatospora sp. NPDC098663]|uniref:hypothetical protein n=1 Tax=Kitasatospora sp. NPDC098663 TaxID=3364096 RepID=UPI00381DBB2E
MEADESLKCPAHTVYWHDVVRVAGRRRLVVDIFDGYPGIRPKGMVRVQAFKSDGGGVGWFSPEGVEKLPTIEFLGMPSKNHFPEFGQPITS